MRQRVLIFVAILLVMVFAQVAEATNAQRVTGYHDGTVYRKDGSSLGWMANDRYYDNIAVPVHNDLYIPNAPGNPWTEHGGSGWNRGWVRLGHRWLSSSVHVDTYRQAHGTSELTYSGGNWYFTTAATGALRTYRRPVRVNYEKYLPPDQPTSITYPAAVDPGVNFTVSWPRVSTADRYRLQVQYRAEDGSTTAWTLVSNTTATSRNVSVNSTYRDVRFRVRADNEQTIVGQVCGRSYPTGGVSSYRTGSWTPIKKAPDATGAFSSPQGEYFPAGSITVSWGPTSSWGHPLGTRNYRLQVSINGSSYTDVALTGTTTSASYNIPDSANGDTIRFRVRAESGGGNSGWTYSDSIIIDTEPPIIQADPDQRDWDKDDVTVNLSFADNGSGLLRQRYSWSNDTGMPTGDWSAWGISTTRSAGTVGNGVWYLHVQAEDRVGNVSETYFGPYKVNNVSMEIDIDDVLFGTIDDIPIYVRAGAVVYFSTRFEGDVEIVWAEINNQVLPLTPQGEEYHGEFRVPVDAVIGTIYPITITAEAYEQSFSFSKAEFVIVVGSIWEDVRLRFIK